jgi:hypothetical protein
MIKSHLLYPQEQSRRGGKIMKELRSGSRWLVLAFVLPPALAALVFAADMVSVESILKYPDSFQRQMITLTGTANGVVQNGGRDGYRAVCLQDFNLDDGTGTIHVRYLALCETVDEKATKINDGDRVVVVATMDVPPDYVASGKSYSLMAMATKVTKSGN